MCWRLLKQVQRLVTISDNHQTSPNIDAYSTPEVMRIKNNYDKCKVNFLLPSKVWEQDRRICSLILSVKGEK